MIGGKGNLEAGEKTQITPGQTAPPTHPRPQMLQHFGEAEMPCRATVLNHRGPGPEHSHEKFGSGRQREKKELNTKYNLIGVLSYFRK